MDAMNVIGNLTAVGEVLGTVGEAVFNNSVGYVAGAVVAGAALAHVGAEVDDVDEWNQFEDISDTKAAPLSEEEPTPTRAVKRQRTATSLVARAEPIEDLARPMQTPSYDSYRRPVATIADATEFSRPRVAPNLRPIIEPGDVEPAIFEVSERLQVPLSVQAIAATRARRVTNLAAVAKLEFQINELRAEIREAEELEPVFTWACNQRMLSSSRSVKRVSKMRAWLRRHRSM